MPETPPLPDIVLDNLPYQHWALDVSDILVMVSTISALLVVLTHAHRSIILRRVWFLFGLLYFYRAVTMYITVLPKADVTYTCKPKMNSTASYRIDTLGIYFDRVVTLISGGGFSINGKHIYCGDYIFSGHTMTLTMAYLAVKQCE